MTWCVSCQHGHTAIEGKCPCCGADLPGKAKAEPKPQKEIITRGGYAKDTNYDNHIDWNKREEKPAYKPVGDKPVEDKAEKKSKKSTKKKSTRKRKYRKRKEKVSG